MLSELLSGERDGIISAITSKVGASEGQAGGFLDKAISMIEGLIGSGDLDIQSLLKGDLSALTSKLDLGSLGSMLGGGEDKAKQGIEALAGPLMGKLGESEDAAGMLGKLVGGEGGISGAIGSLGKMFGKG